MNATRLGPGRYEVESESTPGLVYHVQVQRDRGVCDCIGSDGAAIKGRICKHIRQCMAEEEKHMGTDTTAIAVRDVTPQVVEYNPALPSMDEMKVMVTIANSVYKTSGKLIPSNIKTSEEAFAVMLAGKELGLGPMESFREVYIVNGRTQPSARVLMGMVLRGDPNASFRWIERTAKRACVQLRRPRRDTIEVEYTIEMAQQAGLTKNEVWAKFPQDMLAYKAATRACRLGGPDLITAIGAGVRGAPAVMRAIDEAIDADVEEIPDLDQTPLPDRSAEERRAEQHRTTDAPKQKVESPAVDLRKELRDLLTDLKTTTDDDFWHNFLIGLREKGYPFNGTGLLIRDMTDAQVAELCADIRAMREPVA